MKKKIKIKEIFYDIEADEIHQDIFKVEINDKDYFFYNREGELEQIPKDKVLEIAQSCEQKSVMGANAVQASKKFEFSWEKRAEELQDFYFSQIARTRELNNHGIDEVQVLQ